MKIVLELDWDIAPFSSVASQDIEDFCLLMKTYWSSRGMASDFFEDASSRFEEKFAFYSRGMKALTFTNDIPRFWDGEHTTQGSKSYFTTLKRKEWMETFCDERNEPYFNHKNINPQGLSQADLELQLLAFRLWLHRHHSKTIKEAVKEYSVSLGDDLVDLIREFYPGNACYTTQYEQYSKGDYVEITDVDDGDKPVRGIFFTTDFLEIEIRDYPTPEHPDGEVFYYKKLEGDSGRFPYIHTLTNASSWYRPLGDWAGESILLSAHKQGEE